MRRLTAIVVLSLLGAMFVHADFDVRDWRHYREMSGPAEPGCYTLDLKAAVLTRAKPRLSDLRVITTNGKEKPFEVRTSRGRSGVKSVDAQMYHLSRVPDRGTRFELGIGRREELATEITINTPGQDFRCKATVEGSDDGVIFDFTGDVEARSTLVNLPATDFPLLRVTVYDTAADALKVTGVTVRDFVSRPARTVTFQPERMSAEVSRDKRNLVVIDLGTPTHPYDQIEVYFTDENVRRLCHVEMTLSSRVSSISMMMPTTGRG